jgi:hypothetical protein
MKKLLLSIIGMLICVLGYTQDLPIIIPPSPTAFQMTQYGDITVNESTGKISPSIPLYTYNAGRLSIPISLNYQGNGVKVDQAASWTGINWSLNAAGVITRIVRDKDDFADYFTRNFYTRDTINNMDFYNNPDDVSRVIDFVTSPNIDSQADIFSFSFPGYSGSFYLDEAMHPHLTKYDSELKIEIYAPPTVGGTIQQQKREIVITTPNGVKYFFGGLNASESSKTRYSVLSGNNQQPTQTSFYLHKIVHPLGDEVSFEYSTKDTYVIESAVSESYTRRASKLSSTLNGCSSPPSDQTNIDTLLNQIDDGKFLKNISSNRNNYEVVFNAQDISSSNYPNIYTHYTKVLRSIKVQNKETPTNVIEEISLEYLYPKGPSISQRFFLSDVVFRDGKTYRMEYNHPEDLPQRFSYDQDHAGYFNNKGNQRHIPKVEHSAFSTVYHTLADKSANFEFASKGVLTKLTYPTSGYTKFEYESGYRQENEIESRTKSGLIYINDYTRSTSNKNPILIRIGQGDFLPDPIDGADSSINNSTSSEKIITQKLDIRLFNIKTNELVDHHASFELEVKNIETGRIVNRLKPLSVNEAESFNDPYIGNAYRYPTYIFKDIQLNYGHTYEITLKINATSFTSDALINANMDFTYKVETNDPKEDYGIRVKKVSNYITDSGHEILTGGFKYEYLSSNNSRTPRYLYNTIHRDCCNSTNGPSSGFIHDDHEMVNLVSSSINSLYLNGGNEKMYRKVRIKPLSVDEGGFVEKYFMLYNDALPMNLLTDGSNSTASNSKENSSAVNGVLTKEVNYNKNDSIIKETHYFYNINKLEKISNNVRSKILELCVSSYDYNDLESVYLGMYNTYSNKIQLDSILTKEYFVLDSVEKVITNKISYNYGNYVGLPIEIVKTTSKGDVLKTKHNYPISGALFNEFRIQNPIWTSTEKNNISLNQKNTSFKYYNDLFLPHRIATLKGQATTENFFEDRIIYHSYDDKGNPVEVSKADGTKIYYVWGYQQTQPIAKIEGYTDTQLASAQKAIENAITASNNDNDRTIGTSGNEGNLRAKLQLVRDAFSDGKVTTFTYDPLIGVTSITDPRGETIYNHYDEFNRLEFIKDAQGNILKEHQYNYKN